MSGHSDGEPSQGVVRRIIGVMVYSFARVGAVVGMNVEDYFQQGKRWWFRTAREGREAPRSAGASQRRGLP